MSLGDDATFRSPKDVRSLCSLGRGQDVKTKPKTNSRTVHTRANMNKKITRKYLSVAKEAAIKAGDFLLKPGKNKTGINLEKGRDIKIQADLESERIILDILTKNSRVSILSEEYGVIDGEKNGVSWIVDPLDGSFNYARGIPLSCVSIGLWQENNPVLGVIYDFNRGELFSGIVGEKACLNKKEVTVSRASGKKNAVICTGFPISTDFSSKGILEFVKNVREYKKIRLLGTAALCCAYVSCGRADIYMEKDIRIWDVAAGIALIKAAGGKVEYLPAGKENVYNVKAGSKFIL